MQDTSSYQFVPKPVVLLEGGLNIALPQGPFKQNIDRSSRFGFQVGALFQMKAESTSFVGIDFNCFVLGRNRKQYFQIIDGFDTDISGTVTSSHFVLNVVYRRYLEVSFLGIDPYFEAQIGPKLFTTYLSESSTENGEEVYSNTELLNTSWGLNYGVAAGGQYAIANSTFINLRAAYLLGNSVPYDRLLPKEERDLLEFPEEGFQTKRSPTTALQLIIGLTWLF